VVIKIGQWEEDGKNHIAADYRGKNNKNLNKVSKFKIIINLRQYII